MEDNKQENEESSSSFTIGNSAPETGLSYLPGCYVVPSCERPSLDPETAGVPIIDFAGLSEDFARRASVVSEIGKACRDMGFFQVHGHGIPQSIIDEALSVAFRFFELPMGEKAKYMSSDIYQPVRYGTSLKDGVDKLQFWRVLLKHYAHPLSEYIDLWPYNPPQYREIMGKYCKEVRKVAIEIAGAIMESLGLGPTYLINKFEQGMQVMAVNCYPPCPKPEMSLGLPPHSDYSCLTVLLQSDPGFEICDSLEHGKWTMVPQSPGTLHVLVGDHLEVLSNGLYRSLVHRATLNSTKTRISIASLHSLGMDEKMSPAKELLSDQNPCNYKESSVQDFLDFLSKNDISEGKTNFINTLKINK